MKPVGNKISTLKGDALVQRRPALPGRISRVGKLCKMSLREVTLILQTTTSALLYPMWTRAQYPNGKLFRATRRQSNRMFSKMTCSLHEWHGRSSARD
ncbi:Poly(U)-specific endoribonuclease [Manis javanica]|nr:Poly(U)-specific endoribonuclease [Manis javanica]